MTTMPLEAIKRAKAIENAAYPRASDGADDDLDNQVSVLKRLGDYGSQRFERALAIDAATYGLGHPRVANDLGNLASALQGLGDSVGAPALRDGAHNCGGRPWTGTPDGCRLMAKYRRLSQAQQ